MGYTDKCPDTVKGEPSYMQGGLGKTIRPLVFAFEDMQRKMFPPSGDNNNVAPSSAQSIHKKYPEVFVPEEPGPNS